MLDSKEALFPFISCSNLGFLHKTRQESGPFAGFLPLLIPNALPPTLFLHLALENRFPALQTSSRIFTVLSDWLFQPDISPRLPTPALAFLTSPQPPQLVCPFPGSLATVLDPILPRTQAVFSSCCLPRRTTSCISVYLCVCLNP